jgi:C-3',4' desaturase CrtD
MNDVVIIGAGIAGMAAAARMQAAGLSTLVLEAHGQPGGCAGFYRRKGFAFDVGATTLVDFERGGVGGELLDTIGMEPLCGERLPGYRAWLPDRVVTLHRDPLAWAAERIQKLGGTAAHRRFWQLLDELASVFWHASRTGIRLPFHTPGDLLQAVRAIGLRNLGLVRYLPTTLGDALRRYGLRTDAALCGLLSMLVEDTVHSGIDEAPLINAALGITIRGAGLTRHRGGMYGFWRAFLAHYRSMDGDLRFACSVDKVEGRLGGFRIRTRRGDFEARQVVSAIPAALTASIAPPEVGRKLRHFLERDAKAQGGAVMVCLGVPDEEVDGQEFTHHQLLQDYRRPLGDGNNMFVSVSASGDHESAPPDHRAVMISTHCAPEPWAEMDAEEYSARKQAAGKRLVQLARRVYPDLGVTAVVYDIATPRTYERFTGRLLGAVGGVRQNLANANQNAIPHQLGCDGFWMAGDSTWPGLGTVACVLGSRIVAEGAIEMARRCTRSLHLSATLQVSSTPRNEVRHGYKIV